MSDSTTLETSLVPTERRLAMVLLEAGYLWLELGQTDKAREVFVGAAALLPRSEVPQIGLGTLEFALGRHDKALQAFRMAQKLAPGSGLPRAHVGEALLFLGKDPEALKELKAAMELDPDGDGARLARALLDAKAAGVFKSREKRSEPERSV